MEIQAVWVMRAQGGGVGPDNEKIRTREDTNPYPKRYPRPAAIMGQGYSCPLVRGPVLPFVMGFRWDMTRLVRGGRCRGKGGAQVGCGCGTGLWITPSPTLCDGVPVGHDRGGAAMKGMMSPFST